MLTGSDSWRYVMLKALLVGGALVFGMFLTILVCRHVYSTEALASPERSMVIRIEEPVTFIEIEPR